MKRMSFFYAPRRIWLIFLLLQSMTNVAVSSSGNSSCMDITLNEIPGCTCHSSCAICYTSNTSRLPTRDTDCVACYLGYVYPVVDVLSTPSESYNLGMCSNTACFSSLITEDIIENCTCYETCHACYSEIPGHLPTGANECVACKDGYELDVENQASVAPIGTCSMQNRSATCDLQLPMYVRYACDTSDNLLQHLYWDANCTQPCTNYTWRTDPEAYPAFSFEEIAHTFASPLLCDKNIENTQIICEGGVASLERFQAGSACSPSASTGFETYDACRPLDDPGYSRLFKGWDSMKPYSDSYEKESDHALRGMCNHIPANVAQGAPSTLRCSAWDADGDISPSACLMRENCKANSTCYNGLTSSCSSLFMLGMRVLQLPASFFGASETARLGDVKSLTMSWNRLKAIEDGAFAHLNNLTNLHITFNELGATSPLTANVFDGVRPRLEKLILRRNQIQSLNFIQHAERGSFEQLQYLDLENNAIFSVPSNAFDASPDLSILVLKGNPIFDIEAYAFNGLGALAKMNLRNLGVREIGAYAFNGTALTEIDLRSNNVVYLSHESFAGVNIVQSDCVDFERWQMGLSSNVQAGLVRCDLDIFEDPLASEMFIDALDPGLSGSLGYYLSEACCFRGGGYLYGKALRMDASSTVTCRPKGTGVLCGCGDVTRKYDLDVHSCVALCGGGDYWNASTGSERTHYYSDVGRCLHCEAGTISMPPTEPTPFVTTCVACDPGRYSEFEASVRCETCSEGRYAPSEGMTMCLDCPRGKTSGGEASQSCTSCDFAYVGSSDCTIPIMGIILGAASLLSFVGAVLVGRRKYLASARLAASEAEKAKILSTKVSDLGNEVTQMRSAWRLSWDSIKLKKRLAAGAYGEVWSGILNGRYEVAVKKMLSDTSVDAFNDAEILFLSRARHTKLVLFLGCGNMPPSEEEPDRPGNIFVVLEYMDRGDFQGLVWDNDGTLPWSQRISLLRDAAEGMAYLHDELDTIHRDLKSPNILLATNPETGALVGKIADFGLAKFMSKDKKRADVAVETKKKHAPNLFEKLANSVPTFDHFHLTDSSKGTLPPAAHTAPPAPPKRVTGSEDGQASTKSDPGLSTAVRVEMTTLSSSSSKSAEMTCNMGTPLWMAPEMIATIKLQSRGADSATYSQAVDVYSFGIIMYEAIELKAPWWEKKYQKWTYLVYDEVEAGKRPVVSPLKLQSAPSGYVSLMKACQAHKPEDRPSFADTEKRLGLIFDALGA